MAIPGVASGLDSLVLLLAALAGGVVRGFTGFGFAMVFVPTASMTVGPAMAVSLIWLIDAPFAFPLAFKSFPRANWREVAPLLIGSAAALPVGALLLTTLDRDVARWMIAISIAAALSALVAGWRYRSTPGAPLSISVGALSGLYSGLAQLGGMPLAIFWLGSQTGDARSTRDNMQVFFALTTVLSGVVFAFSGVLRAEHVWTALPLIAAYGVGVLIGVKSFGFATERSFRRIAYAIIAISVVIALPALDPWLR
ncbi:MAG: hypothetical protein BGP06_11455 [Rhizobiales bacterium 65-9]|nr:sulfite exporter TauE/SafE family protein [Hyphomicrobiales bacterium]OJY32928.1 MAG: hypothetical protein BGP06_11455 [Rhizobiales bacterium 65-9]